MSVFFQKFEVRWSDIDANRHLANSAYVNFCAQTRMSFMNQHKMGISQLMRWGIGPVVLHESYHFYKEIMADQNVYVSIEVSGASKDASIYSFVHQFYLEDGTHCATSEVIGVWIDMMLRKSTSPPEEILIALNTVKTENCVELTKEDIKNKSVKPVNIDASIFKK